MRRSLLLSVAFSASFVMSASAAQPFPVQSAPQGVYFAFTLLGSLTGNAATCGVGVEGVAELDRAVDAAATRVALKLGMASYGKAMSEYRAGQGDSAEYLQTLSPKGRESLCANLGENRSAFLEVVARLGR